MAVKRAKIKLPFGGVRLRMFFSSSIHHSPKCGGGGDKCKQIYEPLKQIILSNTTWLDCAPEEGYVIAYPCRSIEWVAESELKSFGKHPVLLPCHINKAFHAKPFSS